MKTHNLVAKFLHKHNFLLYKGRIKLDRAPAGVKIKVKCKVVPVL
jgi:hypothetical protein